MASGISADGFQISHLRKAVSVIGNLFKSAASTSLFGFGEGIPYYYFQTGGGKTSIELLISTLFQFRGDRKAVTAKLLRDVQTFYPIGVTRRITNSLKCAYNMRFCSSVAGRKSAGPIAIPGFSYRLTTS